MVANPFPATREKVEMANCHGQGGDQEWAHTKVTILRGLFNIDNNVYVLGGENNPQNDQKVPGRGTRAEHGTSLCCSLSKYPLSSLVFRSLHRQLNVLVDNKAAKGKVLLEFMLDTSFPSRLLLPIISCVKNAKLSQNLL